MSLNEEVRRQLALLARRSNGRFSDHSAATPTKWQPEKVRNPLKSEGIYFSDDEAWQFVALKLEQGHHVEVITLDKPRGKTGYVMKIELGFELPLLYVKLQLTPGKVFGRSFHYSEFQ